MEEMEQEPASLILRLQRKTSYPLKKTSPPDRHGCWGTHHKGVVTQMPGPPHGVLSGVCKVVTSIAARIKGGRQTSDRGMPRVNQWTFRRTADIIFPPRLGAPRKNCFPIITPVKAQWCHSRQWRGSWGRVGKTMWWELKWRFACK